MVATTEPRVNTTARGVLMFKDASAVLMLASRATFVSLSFTTVS